MAKFTIHDVEHGQLVTLSENDQLWMWDCGANQTSAPADVCEAEGNGVVDLLFITNFDQDHVRGLPELRKRCKVNRLQRNKTLSPAQLHAMKTASGDPLTSAMHSTIDMLNTYTSTAKAEDYPPIPGATYSVYMNSYPADAEDTNNLSLVTVLNVNGTKIVISGDLEKNGWETLLAKGRIAGELIGTDIFIASHHGRENGYSEAVMSIARPRVVVMSDYEVRHATQENMVARYSKHTTGIEFKGKQRRVLTTRSDGTISWQL